MNDLMELERELGPQLRRSLETIIPTDPSAFARRASTELPNTDDDASATVTLGIEDRWSTGTSRRQRIAGIAAAIVVISGAGGVLTLVDRDRPPTTGVTPTVTQPEATDSSTVPGSVAPAAPTDSGASSTVLAPDPQNPPGVYLPTTALTGFSLADISVGDAQQGPPGRTERNSLRYVRRDANGALAAMLTVTGAPTTVADDFGGKQPPMLVHGLPAHIFDSGEGIVSSWQENGVDASVRGWGVSWDGVAALAERTVVDPSNFTVSLPSAAVDGFEPSISDTHPPADAVATDLYFVADDPRPGAFVSVSSSPNSDLMTRDSIEVGFKLGRWTIDRAEVHHLPAIVATSIAGEFGPMTDVSWIEDGYLFTVTGRTDKADLMTLAESLSPATVEQARQLRGSLDTARLALPALDRATLPNGFDVSVRTTGSGANVICLHAPIQRCQLRVSESSLVGDYQHAATGTFWIDDAAWFVGWADGTHDPHLVTDGASGDPVGNVQHDAAGTFFALQASDASTQVVFDPGATAIYSAAVSGPNTDLLN